VLEVRDLSVNYGGVQALRGVSMTVGQAELVALIGANGAGKTTTLKAITAVVQAASGEVLYDGRALAGMKVEEVVALGIAHVPEGRRVFPELTVEENLRIGAHLRKDRREVGREIGRMYELFPQLAERRSQPGSNLSGGEQQMLVFARALMLRPRLLLLDEPSLGLSPQLADEVAEKVQSINASGVAVLLVEQNAALALSLASRGYVLETGEVALAGAAATLLEDSRVQAAYLGVATDGQDATGLV